MTTIPVISMMQFEDLGFCAKGEGPDFVRAARASTTGGDFSAQHVGRTAVGRAGRRGRRQPRPGRSYPPDHRAEPRRGGAEARAWGSCQGFGMINYDRGICTSAAVLAGEAA